VLSSVRPSQAGQASGATNTIREVGGVLGVAVLATVFTDAGGYGSAQAYVDGLVPAIWVGSAVLAVGALVALLVPGRRAAGLGVLEHGALMPEPAPLVATRLPRDPVAACPAGAASCV
jgi:cytochrome c biogenesis factor